MEKMRVEEWFVLLEDSHLSIINEPDIIRFSERKFNVYSRLQGKRKPINP